MQNNTFTRTSRRIVFFSIPGYFLDYTSEQNNFTTPVILSKLLTELKLNNKDRLDLSGIMKTNELITN